MLRRTVPPFQTFTPNTHHATYTWTNKSIVSSYSHSLRNSIRASLSEDPVFLWDKHSSASPLTTILTSWRLQLTVMFPTYPHKLHFFTNSFTFIQNPHSLIFSASSVFDWVKRKQYVCIMIGYNMCVCYARIMWSSQFTGNLLWSSQFTGNSLNLLYLLIIYVVIHRCWFVQTSTGFRGKKTIKKI